MIKSPRNFYVFDSAHIGTSVNIDYGFAGGKPLIFEVIINLRRGRIPAPGGTAFGIEKAGMGHFDIIASGLPRAIIRVIDALGNSLYSIYRPLHDFDVVHALLDSTYTSAYIDGQRIVHNTITPRSPNLSGICNAVTMGGSTTVPYDVCGARIWEVDAIPAGAVEEIHKKVMDPWRRSPVFGDGNMVCEWLLDENVGDASVVIPNSEPGGGGLGPLSITGGAQFQNARKSWRTP